MEEGESMPCASTDRLISMSAISIDLIERDNWPARTDAMFPVSETAALMASVRSCQIVQTTALAETPRSKIAAHHRRRSGIAWTAPPAADPDVIAALSCRANMRRILPNISLGPVQPGPSTLTPLCRFGPERRLKVLG